MHRFFVILAAGLIAAATPAFAGPTDPSTFDATPYKSQKALYDFNFANPTDAGPAFGYVTNHLRRWVRLGENPVNPIAVEGRAGGVSLGLQPGVKPGRGKIRVPERVSPTNRGVGKMTQGAQQLRKFRPQRSALWCIGWPGQIQSCGRRPARPRGGRIR